jgi:hypothetical protein
LSKFRRSRSRSQYFPGEESAGELLDLSLLDAVRRNGHGHRKYTRTLKERLHD